MLQRSSLPSSDETTEGELIHNVTPIEMNYSTFDRE
jgi:hypothetical protein